MTTSWRNLVWLIVFCAAPVAAHDIGVSETELVEHADQRYELKVQAGTAVAHLFPPPQLPERCEPIGNPRGVQGRSWRVFEFRCESSLTADDELVLPWSIDGIMLTANWNDGYEARQLFTNKAGVITVPLAQLQAGSGSLLDSVRRYTGLGIEHILLGVDHLLFVLALLIMVQGAWPLVKTITGFTIAHSITLGLATLGFINVPTRPVEATIALSIAFVCTEIIYAKQGRAGITYRYPWLVAFAFGLLHGLGFAGALSKIGLPPDEIPVALLFFNVGVEIGQLMFIAVAVIAIRLFARLPLQEWQRLRVATVYVIGVLATFWVLERTTAIFLPG